MLAGLIQFGSFSKETIESSTERTDWEGLQLEENQYGALAKFSTAQRLVLHSLDRLLGYEG